MSDAAFEPVRICLVGVSHFAKNHAASIAQMEQEGLAKLTCTVIHSPDKYADAVESYNHRGVTVYHSYEEMLHAERGNTELVSLPVSIPTHAETSIAAMRAGYHVLCEKPPAATIQDLDAMIETSETTGKMCCIGFQNQSKNTVRALKRAVCDGRLGRIQHIEIMATWVRKDSYYNRNSWAGKLVHDGKYCLDGPTNNALAHYLFNALYWASDRWQHASGPAKVRGEMYHAHPIESSDLAGIKVVTVNDVDITYLVTLAGWETSGPISKVYGTEGWAGWAMNAPTVFHFNDGTQQTVEYDGRPEHREVFRNALRYLRGADEELNCPVAMTRPFTVSVNAAFESSGRPTEIPQQFVTREQRDDDVFTAIHDIEKIIRDGYQTRQTYTDMDISWATQTPWIDTLDYTNFAPDF